MSDFYFNVKGRTHYMRIRLTDDGVYEALVDGVDYIHFEADANLEVWELLNVAVSAFLAYAADETTERVE